ncbi:hypothetical protein [Butyricimonas faecihominis]|uniref:hypothetical protein n=1 Tax=Butyricimonas faecihominis TaxID=1472416 RepID=UPI0026DB560E|nr:hypothetical protein [Butyricimonas faecihominis]
MSKKIMFSDKYGLEQAVIEGGKTMTRRVINPQPNRARHWNPIFVKDEPMYYRDERGMCQLIAENGDVLYPKFEKGEVIAIAQAYKDCGYDMELIIDGKLMYKHPGWNNKMFVKSELMPYAIKITDIRAERLQDISNQYCLQEGIKKHISHAKVYYTHDGIGNYFFDTPRDAFASLIDRVSGKGTWESNPFVWVYSFEVIENPSN